MAKVGRPPMYKTPEEMQEKIDEYFETQVWSKPLLVDDKPVIYKGKVIYDIRPPTVAGLTLFLGFADRQSLYDYRDNKKDFTCTIKKAISKIEEFAEIQLTQGNSTGAIFWLKNHGWMDRTNTDITSNGETVTMPSMTINGKKQTIKMGD